METWKHIDGLPTGYEVSDEGNLRIDFTDHFEPMKVSHNGKFLSVCYFGKQMMVHNIVAEAFVDKPENIDASNLCIVHIDGDPHNNKASNLLWTFKGHRNFSADFSKGVVEINSKVLFNSISCAALYYAVPEAYLRSIINTDQTIFGLQFKSATSEDIKSALKRIAISSTAVHKEMSSMPKFNLKHIQEFMEGHVSD